MESDFEAAEVTSVSLSDKGGGERGEGRFLGSRSASTLPLELVEEDLLLDFDASNVFLVSPPLCTFGVESLGKSARREHAGVEPYPDWQGLLALVRYR